MDIENEDLNCSSKFLGFTSSLHPKWTKMRERVDIMHELLQRVEEQGREIAKLKNTIEKYEEEIEKLKSNLSYQQEN